MDVPSGMSNPLIGRLTCDSRKAAAESLFLGLPGETVDGGRYWKEAFSAGSVAGVISASAAFENPPGPLDPIVVLPEPVRQYMGEIAAAFWDFPSSGIDLIGVTGTNGKTTTAYLIEHLSSSLGRPTGLWGTLFNRWPSQSMAATHTTDFADTLQAQIFKALQAGAQIGVMEVSSHALIQHRVAGCRFSGAVFTNLTQDHLDYHSTMEAYFEAKTKLFKPPLFSNSLKSRAVVNVDDPWGAKLASDLGQACWRSSLSEKKFKGARADLIITDVEMTSLGVKGRLISPMGEGHFVSPLIGQFNLMNFLQAVGALLQQGLALPLLLKAVKNFQGVPGRMELIQLSEGSDSCKLPTVLVDYAHTPDGLENALAASRPFTRRELICVFGCGGDRDRGKRPQMGAIASALADRVVVTSDNPRTEDPQQILNDIVSGIPSNILKNVEVDRAIAIAMAIAMADPEDLVLIAGKGHENYQIIGTQKNDFDDRVEARNALRLRLSS